MNEYTFDELAVGQEASFEVRVTQEMMDSFRAVTGDVNPLHNDEEHAREKGFPGRVVYGMLTASFLSTLAGVYLPGRHCLIHSVSVEFPQPVFVGDLLTVSGVVTEKDERFRFITVKATIRRDGKKVCRGTMKLGVSA